VIEVAMAKDGGGLGRLDGCGGMLLLVRSLGTPGEDR
jgi:hypothetical protein